MVDGVLIQGEGMDWNRLLNANRPRQTTTPGDHREEFERDYDRSVFSSPVKRLQDKAQVFPLDPHDSVRTRLTHSLEVSSVAKGLVRKVCKDVLVGNLTKEQDRQIEAIAATCGLLHDLGNPPFGHSGEDAIREWFTKTLTEQTLRSLLENRDQLVQDFLMFEGNAQTLRIVSKLQILADFKGLNLTYGTLSALCKYTASSLDVGSDGDHAKAKLGYFASEANLIAEIRKNTGTEAARNPITFLVEAADDIVYSVADIEDGVKKGIISWSTLHHLLENATEAKAASRTVQEVLQAKERILAPSKFPNDLPDDVHAAAFRTASAGVLVKAAAESFKNNYDAIMEGKFKGELVTEGPTAAFVELLKTIGRTKIYCTHSNLKLELLGRHVIHDLMTWFWEGASVLPVDGKIKPKKFPGKLQLLLSDAYRKVFQYSVTENKEIPVNYYRLQLVTDYVCGMTDTFAKRRHAETSNG